MVRLAADLNMEKILVSACLLGHKVRYDGRAIDAQHAQLEEWQREGRLVPFCPEVAGGLAVPRPAAEILSGNGADVMAGTATVATREGVDVSAAFLAGAGQALASCHRESIRLAILKENSPSCGVHAIHDGSFSGQLRDGTGVTAALLKRAGVRVFSEHEIRQVAEWLGEDH